MAEAPSAFPLAWPTGRPRTKERQFGTELRSKRDDGNPLKRRTPKPITLAEAPDRVDTQLSSLDSVLWPILSSNVMIGVNGRPRSGQANPSDPGAALYFQFRSNPVVLACDTYIDVAQNIAAIGAHIDAVRRIERYGVGTMTQLFTGFLMLPAPMIVDDWRAELGNPRTLEEAEVAFRERIKAAHPDQPGGSHAAAAKLTAAITRAREALADV